MIFRAMAHKVVPKILTLSELIKQGHYDWVDPSITDDNFPDIWGGKTKCGFCSWVVQTGNGE